MEKKQKKVDSQINEWKIKCSELQSEIDIAQKNARVASSEVLKGRASFQGMTVFQIFILVFNSIQHVLQNYIYIFLRGGGMNFSAQKVFR